MRQRDVPLFISPAKAAEIYPRGSRFVFPILNSVNVVRRKCVSHSLRQSEEIPRRDEEASEYLLQAMKKDSTLLFRQIKSFAAKWGGNNGQFSFGHPVPTYEKWGVTTMVLGAAQMPQWRHKVQSPPNLN